MKTNKSYSKRLRITKNGKILSRKTGQDHFNAKKTGSKRMEGKKIMEIKMKNKDKSRFLSNLTK